MKIAMINTPLVSRGGGQRQILKLAFELQKFGHEVEIFTSAVNKEKCYREIIEKLTVTVIPHPIGNKIPKFLVLLKSIKKMTAAKKLLSPLLCELGCEERWDDNFIQFHTNSHP